MSGAAGLKGEIKLFHDSGERERIEGIGELYFLREGEGPSGGMDCFVAPLLAMTEGGAAPVKVLSMRYSGRTPVLRVEGVETREAAEALVGADVYADRDALAPLDEGSFYVEDIIGYEVREGNTVVGAVAGIIDNPAHDILRIAPKGGGKELLLPMVDEFVLAVDGATRTVTVRLPDGLADV